MRGRLKLLELKLGGGGDVVLLFEDGTEQTITLRRRGDGAQQTSGSLQLNTLAQRLSFRGRSSAVDLPPVCNRYAAKPVDSDSSTLRDFPKTIGHAPR